MHISAFLEKSREENQDNKDEKKDGISKDKVRVRRLSMPTLVFCAPLAATCGAFSHF